MQFRVPQPDEASAIHTLLTGIQRHDGLPMVALAEEVSDLFTSPHIDRDLDLRVCEIDGELIGYGIVDHSTSGERLERAVLFGGVHSDHRGRGIGAQLLQWQTERASEQLAVTDQRLPAYLMSYVYDFEDRTLGLLEAHGFERARFDHEMLRSLGQLPAEPKVEGIRIRPWLEADHEPARIVFNASFADHWGSTSRSSEYWEHMVRSEGNRLDLSFVAVDETTDEIVALALNGHFPDDYEINGRLDGWIQSLGTLRSHRKRGIASGLIVQSMHAFVAAGLDHAMLGVDTENPSGAYGIYGDLGFERQHTVITVRKTVRTGAGD